MAGPVGTKIGSIVGGMLGGAVSSDLSAKLLSELVEDDVEIMLQIVNSHFTVLAQEYSLTEAEMEIVLEELRISLEKETLLQMYASDDRDEYANKLLTIIIEDIIKWRVKIILPSDERFMAGIVDIISRDENDVVAPKPKREDNFSQYEEIIEKAGYSEHAGKKARYVAQQSVVVQNQQEDRLAELRTAEFVQERKKEKRNESVKASREMFENLLEV